MSSEAIDDILNCLQELENQNQCTETTKNHIRDLKFLLRYVRIHVKAKTFFFQENIQNCVQEVEMRLKPTRNGIMAADSLEDTLLSLSRNTIIREDLWRQCSFYYQDEYCQFLAHKDVLVDELVWGWLDPLLENLKHLIVLHDLNLLSVSDGKIKDLEEKLVSIRNFLRVTNELLHETSEDLLSKVKVLIENSVYLSYKLWMQRTIFSMDKFVYDLLVKIDYIEPEIRMSYFKFLKASKISNSDALGIDLQALYSVDSLLSNIEELLKDPNDGLIIPLDTHQISSLRDELSFLRYFLMDPHLKQYTEHESDFNSLLMQLESMAREGASVIHSNCDYQKKDNMSKEINLDLSNLVVIVNLLKEKIRKMYLRVPKPSTTNFPRTPNLGFLDFFLKNLEELLKHRASSIAYVKTEIETMHGKFMLLSSFIRNTEEDKHVARFVVDVAYEAERVVDLISASHFPSWYYKLWLYDVIEKIKHLARELIGIHQEKPLKISRFYVEKAYDQFFHVDYTLAAEREVVGFCDQARTIINSLRGGKRQLDVVSIVGIPGGGKTTLAKIVYEHHSVTSYFLFRSWYCMSQVYRRKELLLSILRDVIEIDDKILKMNDEELDMLLSRSLERKRYLIVIDDIWSIEPWNDICNSFPDDNNGSRILLTSRIHEVALQASHRHVHNLFLMSKQESWELLYRKIYEGQWFPMEFVKIGKEIASNCMGLPFNLVVIAGVLMKLNKTVHNWMQVLKLLEKQAHKDYSTTTTSVLELSYIHLPDHLKPCLLYFGTFPEDSEILTWKLIRLWIAEGFVQKKESESLEKVAEGYLMELIRRNLVLISKNKSKRGVKSCQVHDLLHDFCLKKAAEENFLLVSKDMVNVEQYRHSVYCQMNSLDGWMPFDPYIRSLFFFPMESPFNIFYDFSILSSVLKLIRVLDLERIHLSRKKFPTELENLVHLRYLAIGGEFDQLPSSVCNLWRLETLLVMRTKGEVRLPETLLKMAHLKHVYVSEWAALELTCAFQLENSLESHCMENLSTLLLSLGDGTLETILRKLRSLRKLKCILLESRNPFPLELHLLRDLDSLNMIYRGSLPSDLSQISLPSKLRKLTLSNFRLPWREISNIGRQLRHLEVLKLLSEACEGEVWDAYDSDFDRLRFLKLENLDITKWNASVRSFPCLRQLVLRRCMNLLDIPRIFSIDCSQPAHTLPSIDVQKCGYSVSVAAKEIQEELKDFLILSSSSCISNRKNFLLKI